MGNTRPRRILVPCSLETAPPGALGSLHRPLLQGQGSREPVPRQGWARGSQGAQPPATCSGPLSAAPGASRPPRAYSLTSVLQMSKGTAGGGDSWQRTRCLSQGHPALPGECPVLWETAPWARRPEPHQLATKLPRSPPGFQDTGGPDEVLSRPRRAGRSRDCPGPSLTHTQNPSFGPEAWDGPSQRAPQGGCGRGGA